jgi:membrane-bound lytic murein transglycosylase MltF
MMSSASSESMETKYNLPWVLIAAQGYQESGLDQSKRSRAGAIGIMQVKPSTAADPNIGIHNIQNKGNNIHAGVNPMSSLRL